MLRHAGDGMVTGWRKALRKNWKVLAEARWKKKFIKVFNWVSAAFQYFIATVILMRMFYRFLNALLLLFFFFFFFIGSLSISKFKIKYKQWEIFTVVNSDFKYSSTLQSKYNVDWFSLRKLAIEQEHSKSLKNKINIHENLWEGTWLMKFMNYRQYKRELLTSQIMGE